MTLVVMDYSDASVNFHNIDEDYDADTDRLLTELGYQPSECYVMFADDITIRTEIPLDMESF